MNLNDGNIASDDAGNVGDGGTGGTGGAGAGTGGKGGVSDLGGGGIHGAGTPRQQFWRQSRQPRSGRYPGV
ncbi:hypothetical protein [Mycobacterium gastri]|uniref:Uncharacterized protein n=1 Tax=Mycobacterium gastri TaxID=1777 RepID=A0A1X1VMF0_MYCGS|nr:hypothetical protein [Mycobacterium gastri]ETW22353.1 hypothetical protein MGAST_20570 [Mycobacterium gastri 'Wayne']ORV70221.1 hypothetical protein AWC07_05455 [Mycobacterium gastri]